MSKRGRTETPIEILVGTGVIGLVGAVLLLVVRYYEIKKASAEATLALVTAEQFKADIERAKATEIAKPAPLPVQVPSPAKTELPRDDAKPKPKIPAKEQDDVPPPKKRLDSVPVVPQIEFRKPPPDPIIGKWLERRPGTPVGDRIRDFRADGTLSEFLPKSNRTNTGTWRREGNKVYFSQPPILNKWFSIVSLSNDELVILMVGERRFTWFRSS